MKQPRLAVLLVLAAQSAWTAETASFLSIGAGARALGMGGAYTALADDSNSIYWNPSGLAAMEKREVSASHAELTQGTRHDFVAFAQPVSFGTLGAAVTYLSQTALDGRDTLGRPTGSFQASDAAVSLGLGRKTELADLGADVKYLRSHIGSAEAQGFAIDAGARKTLGTFTIGVALRNLGPGLKFDAGRNDLPLRLAVGAAYKVSGGHALASEVVNGPRGAGTEASLGTEYLAPKDIRLRAGYATQSAVAGGSGFDAARGLTLGLGFRNERWSLDYAAVLMGEIGSTHRFTLGTRW